MSIKDLMKYVVEQKCSDLHLSAGDKPIVRKSGALFRLDHPELTNDDIKKIVHRSASILEMDIKDNASDIISSRSRRTPRVANRLLRRVRDYAEVRHNGIISDESTIEALTMLNVDKHGLDEVDRKILTCIIEKFDGGPVGLNTLAAAIAEDMDTIETIYEPYLLQIGMLERTPRGRLATRTAYDHINVTKRESTKPKNFKGWKM